MTKKLWMLACLLFALKSQAQVGIGTTTPHASAQLELKSDAKGLLIPRLSTTQRTAIAAPAKGLMVYDTTVNAFFYHNGAWTQIGDNLGNHTATQNINMAGKVISNNGTASGITLDNGGNVSVTGKVSAQQLAVRGLPLTGTVNDFLVKADFPATGDVSTRKGFAGSGINYIIATGGVTPTAGSGNYYDQAFIGEIRMFAGNFAPNGWEFCRGQVLAITPNQALFNVIGNQYGGNGTTNFALPDLRGAAAIGTGTSNIGYNWSLGERTN